MTALSSGAQERFIFYEIEEALREAGASLSDVSRTRMFVVDIGDWEIVSASYNETFQGMGPATTMEQVSALIDPGMRLGIEIEAELTGGGA